MCVKMRSSKIKFKSSLAMEVLKRGKGVGAPTRTCTAGIHTKQAMGSSNLDMEEKGGKSALNVDDPIMPRDKKHVQKVQKARAFDAEIHMSSKSPDSEKKAVNKAKKESLNTGNKASVKVFGIEKEAAEVPSAIGNEPAGKGKKLMNKERHAHHHGQVHTPLPIHDGKGKGVADPKGVLPAQTAASSSGTTTVRASKTKSSGKGGSAGTKNMLPPPMPGVGAKGTSSEAVQPATKKMVSAADIDDIFAVGKSAQKAKAMEEKAALASGASLMAEGKGKGRKSKKNADDDDFFDSRGSKKGQNA